MVRASSTRPSNGYPTPEHLGGSAARSSVRRAVSTTDSGESIAVRELLIRSVESLVGQCFDDRFESMGDHAHRPCDRARSPTGWPRRTGVAIARVRRWVLPDRHRAPRRRRRPDLAASRRPRRASARASGCSTWPSSTSARQGYRTTSVSEIARAAGLTQATAYAYFDNKESLFVAAVDVDAIDAGDRGPRRP